MRHRNALCFTVPGLQQPNSAAFTSVFGRRSSAVDRHHPPLLVESADRRSFRDGTHTRVEQVGHDSLPSLVLDRKITHGEQHNANARHNAI